MSGPTRPPTRREPTADKIRADLLDLLGRLGGTAAEKDAAEALDVWEAAIREDERKRQRDRLLDWLQGDGPALSFDPSDGASVDPVPDLFETADILAADNGWPRSGTFRESAWPESAPGELTEAWGK